ncbi:MAG TPA: hypothetical protein VNK70_00980, partial [Candidatus Paceibacterota bacterium]|nr:hypothetical protein [Candidatus Paceibacterota bacterium]
MFDFFKTIKRIKALKMIEPDKRWLESRRAMFSALAADSKPSISALPALFGPRLARVVVAFLLITVLTGGAAVNSARAALPDEALYPIKLLSER